jgi:murein DD-endopeptidase MepM/ murein hydrolase activator NlpD
MPSSSGPSRADRDRKARLPMLPRLWLTLILLAGGGCTSISSRICSDYRSAWGCLSNTRGDTHTGIDFRARAGTEVISATHGTVTARTFSECAGHGVVIRTDIIARHEDVEGQIFANYIHVEAIEDLKIAQKVKPGDVIGRVIPLRRTLCYGTVEHVHYELRVRNQAKRHVNPHQFWADGPGNVTCFREGVSVPPGRATAPLRCRN